MTVLLVFGLFVVIATAHNITLLDVPQFGDPRRDVRLVCHYVSETGDPPLHSVKWYRDNNEIFRFTPGQQPPTRAFNTTTGAVGRGSCNVHSCAINVVLPKVYNTRISFTCEVSTEGPRFAVVNQTKYLTVAVTLKDGPKISTSSSGAVQVGEEVILNCSTKPSLPPPTLQWFIDETPETVDPWIMDNTEFSAPDNDGLRSSSKALRVRVDTMKPSIALRCVATQPTTPNFMTSSEVSLQVVRSPHLSMFTAAGSSSKIEAVSIAVVSCISVHMFSKYSALSEV
ncbi:uncharacterized protein [Epargyreus clarus]|uniref:uncharacterized protein n=1 Tax=Epargyreus clarus TaxID=520877 RepID=UPI003C2E33AD